MLRRLLAALIAVVILSGCGETSFLGRRINDFTAYYNTFYNARNAYDQGVKALSSSDQPIDHETFLAVYPVPERTAGSREFEDAIKKSADVIRNHPGSKWAENAVLLIGKSYFYQQNYVSAIQKFREGMSLGPSVEDEARFWLGRALIANNEMQDARDHLSQSLAREEIDPRWKGPMSALLGDVLVRLEEWNAASEALREGAETTRDRETKARAWFALGQVEETRGFFSDASEAFKKARLLRTSYEIEFAAGLNELRTAGLSGDEQYALDGLRRLERDDKHTDKRAEVLLTRGILLQDLGDMTAARQSLEHLLYNADVDVTPVRGSTHYALAVILRDEFEDYVLAAAHFDTAATVLPRTERTPTAMPPTRLAILDSREQAEIFNTYARVYGDVARMDSLLYLSTLSDDEFTTFVHELRLKLQAEMEERRREEERLRGEAAFAEAVGVRRAADSGDLQQQNEATQTAGFLFHQDPGRVQDGRQSFVRRWGDRPLVAGWRRREAVDSFIRQREELDGDENATDALTTVADAEDILPAVDVSAVPRTEEARERMHQERALARYELANVLFLSMNRPDSAYVWYQTVIEEDATAPVAARAMYAIAEIERELGREENARDFYRIVLERYPGSEMEDRVREHLGINARTRTDSLAVQKARFEELKQTWRRGSLLEASSGLVDLGLDATDDSVAPAALFAAAQAGIEWLLEQDRDISEPLPLTVDRRKLIASGLVKSDTLEQPVDQAAAATDSLQAFGAEDEPLLASDSLDDSIAMGVVESVESDESSFNSKLNTVELLEGSRNENDASYVTIRRILEHLASQFATTAFGARSRSLIDEIESRASAEADSLISAESDSLNQATSDSLNQATPDSVDVYAAPADSSAHEVSGGEPSQAVFSLRGPDAIDLAAGGWTLLVAEFADEASARSIAEELRDQDFRTLVLEEDGIHTVYVGQFAQQRMAEAALRINRATFPEPAKTVSLTDLADSP